ncbi:MAG: hypothetical protein MK095_02900 [Phycisphaerales bacterium]|nr:hypothetical protein [Phycisphaerales bacterium]
MTTRARMLIKQARSAAAAGHGHSGTCLAQAIRRQAKVAQAMHAAEAATRRTVKLESQDLGGQR